MSYSHEQRDSERIPANTAVTLTYGIPEKVCEAMCRDVSKSGIGVHVDTVIPLGSECQVKIHDGQNRKTKYQAVVEIKRIFPLEDGMFKLGAIILERIDTTYFKL